jgi:hypothetical protein
MIQSKILIYILAGVVGLSSISSIVGVVKDKLYPVEKTYTKEAVELILKHRELENEIEQLKIENQVIEKDNERLTKSITADSTIIYDSSRSYRDSLRTVLFNR